MVVVNQWNFPKIPLWLNYPLSKIFFTTVHWNANFASFCLSVATILSRGFSSLKIPLLLQTIYWWKYVLLHKFSKFQKVISRTIVVIKQWNFQTISFWLQTIHWWKYILLKKSSKFQKVISWIMVVINQWNFQTIPLWLQTIHQWKKNLLHKISKFQNVISWIMVVVNQWNFQKIPLWL